MDKLFFAEAFRTAGETLNSVSNVQSAKDKHQLDETFLFSFLSDALFHIMKNLVSNRKHLPTASFNSKLVQANPQTQFPVTFGGQLHKRKETQLAS